MIATPEPTVQAVEPPPRPTAWLAREWGPFLLFAGHALFILEGNPTGMPMSAGKLAPLLLMGAMLSQPLVCALWTAWAPLSAVWRLPLGVAACVLLGLAGCIPEGAVQFLAMYSVVFLVLFAGLALARRLGGWRLVECSFEDPDAQPVNSFSIRYLLIWTTVAAVLLLLGRLVAGGRDLMSRGSTSEVVFQIVTAVGLFALMLMPTIAAAFAALGRVRRWALSLTGFAAAIAASTYTASLAVNALEPGSPPIGEVWPMMLGFTLGATLSVFVSSLVLRFSGYRITHAKS